MRRIVQILGYFSYGDAISNHTVAIHRELEQRGVESFIYADYIDPRHKELGRPIAQYEPDAEDVILYHLSTGSDLNRKVTEYPGKLIINYHNITPPHFFYGYSAEMEAACVRGYEDAVFLKEYAAAVVSDSTYNTGELERMGYTCPMYSIPIFMDFADYDMTPDPDVMEKYSDGAKNILFVGRIAPNKKQEDVIRAFYAYTRHFEPNSRLILVGNYSKLENYYLKLKKYAKKLGLTNVIFPGHTTFAQILAYYRTADLFLCQSEHEGFCVPLVEAMHFEKPIVAFDSSAVGETLGEAGILLQEKDPVLTAAVMDQVIRDPRLQQQIRENQKENMLRFRRETVAEAYMKILLGE